MLPSLFTLGNMLCGFAAVLVSFQAQFRLAAVLIAIAIVLDIADGAVARAVGAITPFGLQFDSLADLISFGIAPAVLVYTWALQAYPSWAWVGAMFWLACAAYRLARFNVTIDPMADKRYFVGLPSPGAASVVIATVFAIEGPLHGWAPILPVAAGVIPAVLMATSFRFRSFRSLISGENPRTAAGVALLLTIGLVLAPGWTGIAVAYGYVLTCPLGWLTAGLRRRWFGPAHVAPPRTRLPSVFLPISDPDEADEPDEAGESASVLDAGPVARQALEAAARAADRARVRVTDEFGVAELRNVASLLTAVWGTSQDGPPIPTDVLRAISHAGCNVAVAHDDTRGLVGAAVSIVSPGRPYAYSLIAAVRPGLSDSGVGFALKQHQRAWALGHGLTTMVWTFDPLVSRNARFNLTKLGVYCDEYVPDFYGPMGDKLNTDDSDRLVAVWPLTTDRTIACSRGEPPAVELPEFSKADVRAVGPDRQPCLVDIVGSLWCRVPTDVVALREHGAAQATAWRRCVRDLLVEAFASGYTASGVTRSSWYRLTKEVPR